MTVPVEIAEPAEADAFGVFAVVTAAFGQPDEARLIGQLLKDDAVVLSLVAKVDGLVIGSCVFSRVRLEADGGVAQAVALAPLAVAPPLQRCGVGSTLVRDGLARLTAAGERLVLVVGEPAYYGRFGFSAEAAASIETPWPGPAFQALVLGGSAPGKCKSIYAAAFGAFE